MNIRLVSGDHLETATATAKKAGIIKEGEDSVEYAIMHADDFENKVGMNENE